jgi:hypothetical protein
MIERATLNDLKILVDKLIQEGYGNSVVSCNEEHDFELDKEGLIKYDIYHSKHGITYIDILV